MKPGDKVTFHMIPMHLCQGDDSDTRQRRAALGLKEDRPSECRCVSECSVQLEAEVITVHDIEVATVHEYDDDGNIVKGKTTTFARPQALELEVAMPPEITALGYATRQSHSSQATTKPPESGTWTARA